MKKPMNRRNFLRLSALTGVATGIPFTAAAASASTTGAASQARVNRYVRLGRTNLEIADISFGSSRLRTGEEHLVHHALDKGVNYIDTAESYTGGASETVIGKALKGRPRDDVIIATKASIGASDSAESIMDRLDDSLRRLQTDHVEVFFNHAVNDVNRLRNPEWFEFVERAKRQGKIQFTGMSGHGGYLIDCVNYAVDEDMFDVMLLAHNFGEDPAFYEQFTRAFDFVANQTGLPAAMKRAKEKDVGIVAMKVLRGAKLNDMRPFEQNGHTYSQAAFKWALRMDTTDAAVISMTSTDLIDEFLGASGETEITQHDFELLETYARMTDMTYCRHACNDCEGSCPFEVPISDVLRTRMYAVDYQDLAFAKDEYAGLGGGAAACLGCDGKPCQDACTHGLNIAKLCGPTHLMLG